MPCGYVIDVKQQLVRTTLWGAITGEELREFRDRMVADPEFTSDLSVLVDLSDVTLDRLSAADIRYLASTSTLDRGARRAFVVTDPHTFGLARMFESYREISGGREQTMLFDNLADADAWLAQRPR